MGCPVYVLDYRDRGRGERTNQDTSHSATVIDIAGFHSFFCKMDELLKNNLDGMEVTVSVSSKRDDNDEDDIKEKVGVTEEKEDERTMESLGKDKEDKEMSEKKEEKKPPAETYKNQEHEDEGHEHPSDG